MSRSTSERNIQVLRAMDTEGDCGNERLPVQLVKIEGSYGTSTDTDEAFIVIEGSMRIDFDDGSSVELDEGEMYVVPRGVRHRPCAESECKVMLVEPKGGVNTGDAESELTAPNDEWV